MDKLSDEHLEVLTANAVELVKKLTKAKLVLPHGATFRDHTSRYTRKPIPVIHSDLSPSGAKYMKNNIKQRFLQSTDPKEVQFGQYLQEVEDNHLGFCAWNSLVEEDAIKSNIIPTSAGNALQPWKYRKGQKWYYLKNQQPNEVYVFLQHDDRAADGHGINTPHAAFRLEDQAGESIRMSFDAKLIAIIDPPERPLSKGSKHTKSVVENFKWNAWRTPKKWNSE
ncbi:uncharacterized protein MELLADRAFT_67670 [Melampsora larici-populina 98AG31]|uniref:Uncharacterized protein n=1 Tax=Melampsora larici-populina (strain 98AG31 / pathotype 3-4-7) TaxID=747676 RepID=F4S406_MELLP|nr:uncharacterized protein MELLADRAFT_67670 [Melampsora larici-populina 98AG31]EGG00645.1 hypothetical protein MELLADRAFT_67670 [Melampsora larici-populina 98AG31]